MKVIKLLSSLPSWGSLRMFRACLRAVRTEVQRDVDNIVSRIMGDVLDWLRLTPNAVV